MHDLRRISRPRQCAHCAGITGTNRPRETGGESSRELPYLLILPYTYIYPPPYRGGEGNLRVIPPLARHVRAPLLMSLWRLMLRADGNVCALAHHRLARCSHARAQAKDARPSESSAACLSHIHPLPCRYLRIAPCPWPHMLAAPNGARKNVTVGR